MRSANQNSSLGSASERTFSKNRNPLDTSFATDVVDVGITALSSATLPGPFRNEPCLTRALSEQSVLFAPAAAGGLGARVCDALATSTGKLVLGKFPNSETRIEIHESVRDKHAFVITNIGRPVNDSLFESMLLVQALKLADARRITVVLPYFPYSRQDRKADERPPISAKAVTDIFKSMGAHQIVTVDLHATQVEGFFDGPFENLSGLNQLVRPVLREEGNSLVVCSPDSGGAKRAEAFSRQVEKISGDFTPLVVMSKFRPSPTTPPVVTLSAGPEVLTGKTCALVDDIIDTCGTMIAAAAELKARGAARVIVCASHAVLSGDAVKKLCETRTASGERLIDRVYVTDTLPVPPEARDCIQVVSVAPLIAEAVSRLDRSMGTLRELKERTDLGELQVTERTIH